MMGVIVILAITLLKVYLTLVPPEVCGLVQGLAAAGHDGLHLVQDLTHSGQDLLPGLDIDARHLQTNT